MRRPRLIGVPRFRPITRVPAPAPAARLPSRFRPLAMVFRRSRTRWPTAPAPTLVATDGTRITIAPRLRWHLHLHQHLHLHVPQPLPDRAKTAAVLNGRATRLAFWRRAQPARTVRLTATCSRTGGDSGRMLASVAPFCRHQSQSHPLPQPVSAAMAGIVHRSPNLHDSRRPRLLGWRSTAKPSPQAGASTSGQIGQGQLLVTGTLGGGGQSTRELRLARSAGAHRAAPGTVLATGLSTPTIYALEQRSRAAATALAGQAAPKQRTVPVPAVTSASAFIAASNRAMNRSRSLLGLYLSRTGGPRSATVVPGRASDRREAERPVSPAAITFRRTAEARGERVPQPPERAVSATPAPARVDLDRISEEVIRRIERRSRIERERRGLL
jgi:hypothetical protein